MSYLAIAIDLGDHAALRIDGTDRQLQVVAILPTTLAGPDVLLPADQAIDGSANRYIVTASNPAGAGRITQELSSRDGVTVTPMDQWIREASDEAERLNRNIMIAIVGLVAIYATVAMANAAAIAASERQARVRHPMGPGDRDRGADHDRHRHHNTAHSTGRRLGRLLLGAGSTT